VARPEHGTPLVGAPQPVPGPVVSRSRSRRDYRSQRPFPHVGNRAAGHARQRTGGTILVDSVSGKPAVSTYAICLAFESMNSLRVMTGTSRDPVVIDLRL